jgi:hypothetical protein
MDIEDRKGFLGEANGVCPWQGDTWQLIGIRSSCTRMSPLELKFICIPPAGCSLVL